MAQAQARTPDDRQDPRIGSAWRRCRPEFGVLLLGLILSVTAYRLTAGWETQRRVAELRERVAVCARAVDHEFAHLIGDVEILARYYAASTEVDADEFRLFTRPLLTRHPSLRALEWVPRVREPERAAFEAQVRAQGPADFRIWELEGGLPRPAGPRTEYFPAEQIEPLTGAVAALGFDEGSEPLRRAALERARDAGQPAASAPLHVGRDTGGQPMLAIFVPQAPGGVPGDTRDARRERLQGLAMGLVSLADLVERVIAELPPHRLDLVLRDADLPGDAGVLHVHPSRARRAGAPLVLAAAARDAPYHEARFPVAGRTLVLRGLSAPGTEPQPLLPLALLGLGLAISAALAALVRHRRTAAVRLRASEERLRLALDAAQMGIYDWEIGRNRIIWSPEHERLWGFAPGEFDGTYESFSSRIHPDDRSRVAADIARCIAAHARCSLEYRVIWPDGSLHWVAGCGEFVFDAAQRPLRMHGTVMEITERKGAEVQLRRYQQIVETSGEMLLFIDRDLCYQVVNPAYAALHQVPPPALHGSRVRTVVGEEIFARIGPELAAALAGEPRRFGFEASFPGGRSRYLEADYSPFWDEGEVRGIVLSLHDLTGIRDAQAALEAERANLEQRVAERTAQLQGSESKLRTITERLQLATEAGGIGVWEWDLVNDRLTWDERAYHLYGRQASDEALCYADWAQGIHPADLPPLQAALEEMLAGRYSAFRKTFRMSWADGTLHYLVTSGKLIRDAAGVAQHLIGVNWDITTEKLTQLALEASEVKARALIDAAPVPMALAHETGATTYINAAFTASFGYTLADIPTWTDWRLKACPDPVYREWVMNTRKTRLGHAERDGKPCEPLEVTIRCKDGSTRTVMARITPLAGEDRLNTIYDITDLKQAREDAEQAARIKAEFLAHMSHEIRTPMNGIIGLAELALRETLEPKTRDYLEKLHQSGRSLLRILNDILDHSKIEAGRMRLDPAPFERDRLLDTLHALFDQAAASKGLGLLIEAGPDVPPLLLGDALRLQQVLSNLLGNALKFTAHGEVSLRVDCLERDHASARLQWTVTDSGIGMDAATRARLFEPFTQGDRSIARRFGGTGLGLSISRDLVHLMGGELTLESTLGAGSRFRVDLRLGIPGAVLEAAAQAPARGANLAGARVLVADDQPINRQVIGDMLRLLGIAVAMASDGREALEHLALTPCDAVLMDIEMPAMDGLTATRRIRATPAWAQLPVIAITAGVTAAERDRITDCGVSDLLAKPVTLDALTATLGRWIGTPSAPPSWVQEPATAPGPGAAALPGFHLRGLQQTTGDATLVNERLRQFAATVRDDAAAIAAALAVGDGVRAGELLHRLKGTSGTLGATDLYAASTRLEADLEANRDPAAALESLRQTHRATLARIADLPPPPAARTVTPAGTPAAVRHLVTAIQARLAKGLLVRPDLMAELGAALPARDQALYHALKRHLDQFDYRAATRLLAPLLPDVPEDQVPDHEG